MNPDETKRRRRSARRWPAIVGLGLLGLLVTTGAAPPPVVAGAGASFGLWSLLPAVVALALAFTTGQVLPSLFAGVVAGSVVLFAHSGVPGDLNFIDRFFLPALGSRSYATILLVYLWFLGGILGIWGKTGAAQYFAEAVGARLVRGPRTAKLFAWIVGVVFHQGGTVSTVLAGTTVKPVADRHKVSHEELAYLVDSTASPVATVLPFNAWPAYVGGLVAGAAVGGVTLIDSPEAGIKWFFASVPFNFYGILAVLGTLLFSLDLLPWTGRRMGKAIRRARETGRLDAGSAQPIMDTALLEQQPEPGYRPGLIDFLLPLGVLIGLAVVPLVVFNQSLIEVAFLASTLSAMVVGRLKGMSLKTLLDGFLDGCRNMTVGAIILGLAITLGQVSKDLDTADFFVSTLAGHIPAWLLPLGLTVSCMVIAFSIGSSFGTYAVIFPIAVPLAFSLAITREGLAGVPVADLASTHPEQWAAILFYVKVCFGAVIGGSVFGDQCSPISDTTVLSSMFTGCDLMDHVKTQLPLALAAAALGAALSTLLVVLF